MGVAVQWFDFQTGFLGILAPYRDWDVGGEDRPNEGGPAMFGISTSGFGHS
jgi:hypothetical protein